MDGAFRVVLMREGDPEDPDDRVPDELLHDPAVGVDLCPGHRGVGREHPVDIFGIGRLRRRGEPDQVAEEGGDDLALLATGPEGRPNGAPQSPQNRCPSGFDREQEGQVVIQRAQSQPP